MKTYTRVWGGLGYTANAMGQALRSKVLRDDELRENHTIGSDIFRIRQLAVGEAYLCYSGHTWVRIS